MKRANVGPVLAWCLVFPLIFVSSAFGQSCNRFIGRWKSPNVFMQTVDELTIAKDGDGFLVVGHVSYGEFNGKFPAECQEGKLVLSVKQFGDIVYSNERDVLYFGGKEFHRVVGGPPAGGAGVDRTRKAEMAAVPSSEYRLAGLWKTQCANNFGLAIAPAGDRYYSISFCGPGGCAEPGTYRPNSRIVNDPNYRLVNNDTIEVQGKDGFTRYLRCPSGGLAKTAQPPTPKAGCDAATDLGYSLLAGGHLYKVKGIASPSGGQVHVFFDEKGALVQDQNLLQKLALVAWTREKIVKNSAARDGSTRISALLSASTIVARDTALADFAARGMTEALEAYLTGGASLSKAVPNLTASTLKGLLLNSPRTLFWLAGRRGLESSREKYELLARILPPQDEAAFDVTTLEAVRRLYTEADGLELPNAALLTAMMPMTVMDNLKDLAGSVLSEVLPGVPNPSEAVTLDGLLKLQKSVANYGRGRSELQAYSQSLDQVLRLAAEENTVIGSWAQNAAGACQP